MDGDGLYLWIYRNGRKYWRMRYWQAGKEKSLSIGVYPKVTLSDARRKREELRKQLEADLDPSAERKATNLRKKLSAENSFEAVALELYNKQLHTWVPHHADDVKRRLESNIFPVLGKRPLDQIEAPELLQAIRKIETRGSYDLAHRVLQVCGQVFRYGIATGRCTRPARASARIFSMCASAAPSSQKRSVPSLLKRHAHAVRSIAPNSLVPQGLVCNGPLGCTLPPRSWYSGIDKRQKSQR